MALDRYFSDQEIQTLQNPTNGLTRKVSQESKEIRKVSLKAYDEKRADLTTREKQVLKGVTAYRRVNNEWPTANEVKSFLISKKDSWNQFTQAKSRVTDLKNKRQLVEHDKRECSETGMTAWSVKPAEHLRIGDQ